MAEPDNGKEVCDTAEERDCAPWQWGNLEKPPGWTGQSALRSYRGGRQRVSLHLGAHLLHTPPNLPPSPVFYYQGLSATSWNSKSGLFPQNKLSLLSSCSSEVQDVLRGASPRRTPFNLYRRAWGEMGTEAQRTAGSVTLEESKYILFLKRNSHLLKNPVTLTYQANSPCTLTACPFNSTWIKSWASSETGRMENKAFVQVWACTRDLKKNFSKTIKGVIHL